MGGNLLSLSHTLSLLSYIYSFFLYIGEKFLTFTAAQATRGTSSQTVTKRHQWLQAAQHGTSHS